MSRSDYFIGTFYDRPLLIGQIVSTFTEEPGRFMNYQVLGFEEYNVVLKCLYTGKTIKLPKIFYFVRKFDAIQLNLF